MKEITDLSIIYIACKDRDEAKNIANYLIINKLAACCSIFPQINSIYEWKGKICDETESLLMIKTKKILFDKIRLEVLRMHSYEVPEIIATDVSRVHDKYANWIEEVLDERKL